MFSDIDNYDKYIPDDVVQEINEYEKKLRRSNLKGKTKLPSNEDIVNAIIKVTGGSLTRYNIENLYDNVIEYLKHQGFNTSVVSEYRVERLVESLIRKGSLSKQVE